MLVGTGVAASTYPARRRPSRAVVRAESGGRFTVRIAAADIGTGARTVLTQIAADALGTTTDRVDVELGDSALPRAWIAGGSMGTASWGSAVAPACVDLRDQLGDRGGEVPADGLEVAFDTTEEFEGQAAFARHAFGAQFAEVRVDVDSGEVRVPRLLGIVGTAAALANAVHHATGIQVRDLPIRPDRLLG
ncbi:MAG TPA: molybdopterin cofactor-binding domain-containing protein [Streptosporangiaceae bacterium]